MALMISGPATPAHDHAVRSLPGSSYSCGAISLSDTDILQEWWYLCKMLLHIVEYKEDIGRAKKGALRCSLT
jgi:hypothetical protein